MVHSPYDTKMFASITAWFGSSLASITTLLTDFLEFVAAALTLVLALIVAVVAAVITFIATIINLFLAILITIVFGIVWVLSWVAGGYGAGLRAWLFNEIKSWWGMVGGGFSCLPKVFTLPFRIWYDWIYQGNYTIIENKNAIDTACACLPPRVLFGIIKYGIMGGKPLARAHLQHYLDGSGADYVEDIATFINVDGGVRKALVDAINAQGAADRANGSAGFSGVVTTIQQGDYENQDYRYAFGNIDEIHFAVLDTPADRAHNRSAGGTATVHLRMRDPYEWHPAEDRPSQCLHAELEAAKAKGAKDYYQVGEATVDLAIDPAYIPR